MKENKDTVDIKDVKEEMMEKTAEEEEVLTEKNDSLGDGAGAAASPVEKKKAESVYCQPAAPKTKKTDSWGSRGVTRKFLVASLVLTLLLNAALTAGISSLFGRHGIKSRPGFSDNQSGRPDFGQFDDDNEWNNHGGRRGNGGRMMSPGAPFDSNWNGKQNNNQNAAPDSNQNAAPDTNQDNTQNNTQNKTQNDAQTQGTSFEI